MVGYLATFCSNFLVECPKHPSVIQKWSIWDRQTSIDCCFHVGFTNLKMLKVANAHECEENANLKMNMKISKLKILRYKRAAAQ